MGATPSGLSSAHLHHPQFFYRWGGCPSCRPTNSVKALKASLLEKHLNIHLKYNGVSLVRLSHFLHLITKGWNGKGLKCHSINHVLGNVALMRDVKTVTLEQLKNATKTKWSWIDRDMFANSHTVETLSTCHIKRKKWTYSTWFLLICIAYQVCCAVFCNLPWCRSAKSLFYTIYPLFYEFVQTAVALTNWLFIKNCP